MNIDKFEANFVDGEYVFDRLPNQGEVESSYRSNGFTYTPNRIQYHDTLFIIYCNHELNEHEFQKLNEDWRRFCPH